MSEYTPQAERVLNADERRAEDVQLKHARVREFLTRFGYDGLLLQCPHNVAWFTAGADVTRSGGSETSAALFVTPEARVMITDNVDSPQLFEREIFGLGFQLKERPWHEPKSPR